MACEFSKYDAMLSLGLRPFLNPFEVGIFCEILLSKDLPLKMPMRILGGTAGESEVSFIHRLRFVLLGTSQAFL